MIAYCMIKHVPSSSNLSKYKFSIKLLDTSIPSTSVNLFRHIVRPFNELLFWTLAIRTFIWAGRRSIPEVVNYKFVVFVFRSFIMCPKRPK